MGASDESRAMTVRLSPELHRAVQALAEQDRVSMAEWVRGALLARVVWRVTIGRAPTSMVAAQQAIVEALEQVGVDY